MEPRLRASLVETFDEYSFANEATRSAFIFLESLQRVSPFLLAAYLDIMTTSIREPVSNQSTLRKARDLISLRYIDEIATVIVIALDTAVENRMLKINHSTGEDIWCAIEDKEFFAFMDDYVRRRSYISQGSA